MGILLGASTGNEFLPTKYLSAVEPERLYSFLFWDEAQPLEQGEQFSVAEK